MGVKVGIPSGLFNFEHKLIWNTFFTELGAEIIDSGPTNRRVLDDGIESSVAEACLPVKVFHGHVMSLKDKADYILIPRYTSISAKKYICPKFGGLPDLIRSSIDGLPPVIDVEINFYRSRKQGEEAAIEAGSYISRNVRQIRKAYKKALDLYEKRRSQYLDMLRNQDPNPSPLPGKKPKLHPETNHPANITIALLGHSYIIQDNYLNMNMNNKLQNMGVAVITPDMRETSELRRIGDNLPKKIFWDYGARSIGFARKMIEEGVDGLLYISSFGCGIDSFVGDIIAREVKNANIPFSLINIDEHTGEAGIDTRLEAFTDMVVRRRNKYNENHISALG